MTLLLQLAQSYTDPDSHGYKLAWQRAYLDDLLGDKDFGDLAFEDQVQLAMLGDTVIQGGYLRAELINARAMRIGDEQDNVLVTKDGISVKGGNITVTDEHNKAVMTSRGLKMKYVYVSYGPSDGWKLCGVNDHDIYPVGLYIYVYLPGDFIIDKAMLHVKSIPLYLTNQLPVDQGGSGAPDGFYHVKDVCLYKAEESDDVSFWADGFHVYTEPILGSKTDITDDVWESKWSPTGEGMKVKSGDVSEHLTVGGRAIIVAQSDLPMTAQNYRYQSYMQAELEIEGFLRG
jgi:hypothetical protein